MLRWLRRWRRVPAIAETDWQRTLRHYPFLAERPGAEQALLRTLCAEFLRDKEFHGARGFEISNEVALAIAAQAVLPVLHLPGRLDWYDDFVGIVVLPSEVTTPRVAVDEIGVVHEYEESIVGEARARGGVMLSWPHVREAAGPQDDRPVLNVVIHEFVHKIDMRDGEVDGCPPLPASFQRASGGAQGARRAWFAQLEPAYQRFREQAIVAERFGGEPPWLDTYAATSHGEFFAVACEAYFTGRDRFAREFPELLALFDAFFLAGHGAR